MGGESCGSVIICKISIAVVLKSFLTYYLNQTIYKLITQISVLIILEVHSGHFVFVLTKSVISDVLVCLCNSREHRFIFNAHSCEKGSTPSISSDFTSQDI